VSYTYDGNGERVLKSNTSTGAAVKRYWSMGGNTLAEGDGSGNLTAEYIYFGGKRVARIDLPANTVHYYLSDHLGSTSIVATATGTVEEESDYYPFGTEVVVTSGQNHYKFTGKERDTETNVDYFGARYYTSNMGRWMNPDQPFADQNPADPQSWNLYEYARNNPLRNIDIDGFKVLEAVVAQARAQIAATAAAGEDTFTMVFLGVNSGVDASTGLARSTLTGDSIGQWSNEFGLGNLDTSASGNTVLLPNDSNAVSAFIGSANQDQIDTANAIAPLVSDAGLSMDGISHSNGVNALGAVAAGGVKFDSTVVIAPNTSSTNTMSNIVNASQGTTIISSPNDSRLAETPAHKSPPAWQRIFGKDPKVNVQQTDQKGHGAQCYAAEIHGQDSTSVGGCK
jgi:RHS repeat-associated protein